MSKEKPMSKKDKKNKNKKKKGKKIVRKILLLILIVFIVFGGYITYKTYKNGWGLQGFLATLVGNDATTKETLPELRVLILGISEDIDTELTDTIMIASYNPNTQKATLLSIPRDTFVGKSASSAGGSDKINALYQKSIDKTLDAVNGITGLNIENYVVIENNALVSLVDAIGGVEFDVPIDMNYDDKSQNLHIHLKAGVQKLTGEQAEGVVRFRHNNNGTSYPASYGDNDIGRMKTQRNFIMALLKQTLQVKNIFKLGELMDVVNENVKTNMSVSYLKKYLPYAVDFSTENIQTEVLSGASDKYNNLWFFIYNKTQTQTLITELYAEQNATEENVEGTTEETTNTASTSTNTTEDTSSVSKTTASKIKIEVLNGSGTSSNLTKVVNALKKKGYTVSKTSSTTSTSKTTIINKSNQSSEIESNIKTILGVGNISTSATSSSSVDFTIIIGKDYK